MAVKVKEKFIPPFPFPHLFEKRRKKPRYQITVTEDLIKEHPFLDGHITGVVIIAEELGENMAAVVDMQDGIMFTIDRKHLNLIL